MKKNFIMTLSSLLLMTSCGGRKEGPNLVDNLNIKKPAIIVGDLDWQDVDTSQGSSPLVIAARAVADLELPSQDSRCTAFLISDDVIMTNHHCIPSASYANGAKASFRHEKSLNKSEWETFDCSIFVGNNQVLDFALLKCKNSPGKKFGKVELSEEALGDDKAVGKDVYVIQQNCDYYLQENCDWSKKIAYGQITHLDSSSGEYAHNADTLGGSSGSPVFAKDSNKVIALHHVGIGNNGFGRGRENFAVPMKKILPVLKSQYPTLFTASSAVTNNLFEQLYEPNNTFASAKEISQFPFDSSILGQAKIADSRDFDFFKIRLDHSSRLNIQVSFDNDRGDLDLRLYNASGKLMLRSESTSDLEQISRDFSAGEYTLLVYGYKGATNDYQLEVDAI